ncbi:NLRP3 [Branchiostoma lanceolatum]|uniref:NLRP3 protein n=1 Tax=Branchiostoma lanceolatum TaxID=7740 RepID=A0A8J9YXQ9_BRALA|nr:NLRP3 [Branchiostoma lanceolatum]
MEARVSTTQLEFVAHRLLPGDWRTLGRKLLTTIDPNFPNVEGILGNLEFSHQDEGVRKIILQTMIRWQSMWGDKATVALLVGALEDLGMMGIAGGLREMVAQRDDPTAVQAHTGLYSVVEMKGGGDAMVPLCKEALKNHYTTMYESNFPSVWRHFGINVHTARIPLQVVRLDRSPTEKLRTQVDVEVPLDQHTVMFQGPAGVGKTQLCYKMACDWAAEKDPRLKNVQLLFVLSATSNRKGDILDAVYDQIFPAGFVEKVPKKRLERWIKANSSSVMFVIDDVDAAEENVSPQDVEKSPVHCYIKGTYLRKTRSILTCRRSPVSTACNAMAETPSVLPHCDAHYLINGFSEGAVDELISKFFSRSDDSRAMGRRLKETVSSDDYLSGIVQNPMYAFMVCALWERRTPPPTSLAQLIEQFIALISGEYSSRKSPSMSTKSMQTTLHGLGKLAWASLQVGPSALTHQNIQDVIGDDVTMDMGLLQRDQSAREDDHYKFVHRIIWEYFAAKHVATASSAGDQVKHLQTLWSTRCRHNCRYGDACLFVAGLLQDKSHDLFAAFKSNTSEMTKQGSPPCCLNTVISQACLAVVESGHPNITAPLVSKALPRDVVLDFQGKPPTPNVLHGLAELIATKQVPETISLKNLWITKSSSLLHLGEAIKSSKGLSSLHIDVTGMDMSLSNPERADNTAILSFHRCISENRGIACLQINADINDMDESAVVAIPQVIESKPDLLDFRLVINVSTSCSTRCRNMIAKGHKVACKREKNIEVFNERLADALDKNKTLRSLWISVEILRHKLALQLVAPAIASHPCISSFKVSGSPSEESHNSGYGIDALAHVLLKSKTLKSFSLSLPSLVSDTRCDASSQRVDILCAALKGCRTLEKLDLSFTYLFAREKLLLAEVIMSGRSLKEVSFSWKKMNGAFLVAFCRAVRAKAAGSLKKIALSGEFDSRGLVRLGKTILASPSLLDVRLEHSRFHDKGLEEFVDEVMEAVASFPDERDAPLQITLQGTVAGDCSDDDISTAELLSVELQDSDHTNLRVQLEAEHDTTSPAFQQEPPPRKSNDFAFMIDLGKGDSSSRSQQEQAMRWLTRR